MRQILYFLRLLKKEKIQFIVVGMSAARLHGAPVVTQDFDLWVPHIEADVLADLASRANAILSGGREPPCALNFTEDMPIDLVRRLSSHLALEYALKISPKVRIGNVMIPVLSMKEIIASKKAARRPKDLAVLPILRNFIRVKLKVQKSQRRKK